VSPHNEPADLWPEEPPFTAFKVKEGHLDLRVFDQAVWWLDRHARPHRLADMGRPYLNNVAAYLLEHAAYFHRLTAWRDLVEAVGDAVYGQPSGQLLAEQVGAARTDQLTPTEWLEATPLMRRIRQLLAT
jgi:hypothetical protein